jgi:putative Mg2+ transporter-C (MgtC) family protein
VFVNLGLRPLVKWIKKKTRAGVPVSRSWKVVLSCPAEQEAATRGLVLRTFGLGGLHLSEIGVHPGEGQGTVELSAVVNSEGGNEVLVEQAVQRLGVEPGLLNLRWEALEDG